MRKGQKSFVTNFFFAAEAKTKVSFLFCRLSPYITYLAACYDVVADHMFKRERLFCVRENEEKVGEKERERKKEREREREIEREREKEIEKEREKKREYVWVRECKKRK